MRTDPRAACANDRERKGWAIVHDLLAHPLMAITLWSRWSLAFHDWTSNRAWPRSAVAVKPVPVETLLGIAWVADLGDGIWSVTHPFINHTFRTKADDIDDAVRISVEWFCSLDIPTLMDAA